MQQHLQGLVSGEWTCDRGVVVDCPVGLHTSGAAPWHGEEELALLRRE